MEDQTTRPGLVLASASPRRRDLLQSAGLQFVVRPTSAEESIAEDTEPRAAALEIALRKWRAAERTLGPSEWALAADTVVGLPADRRGPSGPWRLLGKARDEIEARWMLSQLSGSRHGVATGVVVGRRNQPPQSAVACTWVTMRALEPAEIEAYVRSGEWRDKAGAYAIQAGADRFVTALEGDGWDNVVGLPVELAVELLRQSGYPLPAPKQGARP